MIAPARTTPETIRPECIAVIGLGYISDFHIDAIRRARPTATIVGCDVAPKLGRQALESGRIDAFVGSVDEMLGQRVDAAHVLVPPQLHHHVADTLLNHGVDVLIEKPLAVSTDECDRLFSAADTHAALLATSHNQLFYRTWDTVRRDLEYLIGSLVSIDMVSRRPLSFLRAGDTAQWMMRGSTNILFEVAPHAFAQVLDVVDDVEISSVVTTRPHRLSNGVDFYANWNIVGVARDVPVSISLSFADAFSQTAITLRGTLGSVVVDFDLNTVDVQRRGVAAFDVEKLELGLSSAAQRARGAVSTFADVVLAKAGVNGRLDPFSDSINRSVRAFHAARASRTVDERQGHDLSRRVVAMAQAVAEASGRSGGGDPAAVTALTVPPDTESVGSTGDTSDGPAVVVLGATGFIGESVVRRLAGEHHVRVVARSPQRARTLFSDLDVEVVAGDLEDPQSLTQAVRAGDTVVHLAYSGETEWPALVAADVEPTLGFARSCAALGVRRFVYASSIAGYHAGREGEVITEATPFDAGVLRASPYARSKAEIERGLLDLHRRGGVPVVIARPGVVVGERSDPCHWGVAAWPHPNVCRFWGSGNHALPLVLVEDVADAVAAMVTTDGIDGRSFNLCAPGTVTARDYVSEMERCGGSPILQRESRLATAFAADVAKWSLKRLRDHDLGRPSLADRSGRSFAARFDCSAAETDLGWKPVSDRAELLEHGVCVPAQRWAAASSAVRSPSLVEAP